MHQQLQLLRWVCAGSVHVHAGSVYVHAGSVYVHAGSVYVSNAKMYFYWTDNVGFCIVCAEARPVYE